MDSAQHPVAVRQRLLIDQSVQGSLLRRAAFYSLACGLYFLMTLVITESLSNPHEAVSEITRRCLDEAVFWAPGVMLLTPIIVYDLLKITNRLAGPIFRLRRELQRLSRGQTSHSLTLRDGDYWQEVAESFNQIRQELLELREVTSRDGIRNQRSPLPCRTLREHREVETAGDQSYAQTEKSLVRASS